MTKYIEFKLIDQMPGLKGLENMQSIGFICLKCGKEQEVT